MHKVILMMVLVVVSNSAIAEWTKWNLVTEWNDSPNIALYVGPVTSHKGSNMVKMWHLWDFRYVHHAEDKKYLSETIENEYDCKEQLSRKHNHLAFSGNMGYGMIVYSNRNVEKWDSVAPGTNGELVMKIACGK